MFCGWLEVLKLSSPASLGDAARPTLALPLRRSRSDGVVNPVVPVLFNLAMMAGDCNELFAGGDDDGKLEGLAAGDARRKPFSMDSSSDLATSGSVHGTTPIIISVPVRMRHGLYKATCA